MIGYQKDVFQKNLPNLGVWWSVEDRGRDIISKFIGHASSSEIHDAFVPQIIDIKQTLCCFE